MLNLGIERLDFVTIYTKDLTASREFYVGQLGFPILREVHGQFFQINVAGVPICVDVDTAQPHQNNLGIVVSDLNATETALRERNLTVHSGYNHDSHERWLGVMDPDGNEVIFLVRETC